MNIIMMIEILLFFVLGLILGSFLNSWLYRSQKNLSLWERSVCPNCKKKLLARDLIPLISFIFLKAKCRFCKEKISWQYFLVELMTGVLFVLVFWHYQTINLFLGRDLFFVLILIFIFVYDLKFYLILDQVIYPVLVIALLVNLFLGINIYNLIFGSLLGAGFFLIQYLISSGKWVGWGDVKLGLLLGVMLGWQLLLVTLVLAYIVGGLIAGILVLSKKKKMTDVLPMGTFLTAAAIIALLWGDKILSWYF